MSGIYTELLERLKLSEQAALITVLREGKSPSRHLYEPGCEDEGTETISQKALHDGRPYVLEEEGRTVFCEPFTSGSGMVIFGGGHVSLALYEFAYKTGFAVTVVDDRMAFANTERFPYAREVITDDFTHAIEGMDIHESDYLVILTRGHRHDGDCLRALYKKPHTVYTGMIGSRRRTRELKDLLRAEGLSADWLESIHTPVGLSIGAVTPEEIAVSILAEIIEVKRKSVPGGRRLMQSDIDMAVIEELAGGVGSREDMPKAIVTIMSTKGSTPRKAGAKMIVYADGVISGTIGGGCAEGSVISTARRIAHQGGYRIVHEDMTGTVAEDEGMVCGGTMEVLVEKG